MHPVAATHPRRRSRAFSAAPPSEFSCPFPSFSALHELAEYVRGLPLRLLADLTLSSVCKNQRFLSFIKLFQNDHGKCPYDRNLQK